MAESKPDEDVTALLVRVQDGDAEAMNELFPIVQPQLERIARSCMRKRPSSNSVETMMLVNDVAQRILGVGQRANDNGREPPHWQNRHAFFAYAAKAVMHILISWDRKRLAAKRGGNPPKIHLEDVPSPTVEERPGFWIEIGEALEMLEKRNPTAADVVRYRLSFGMSDEEIARQLEIPTKDVPDLWHLGVTILRMYLDEFLEE